MLGNMAAFAVHMGKSYSKDKKGALVEVAGRAALGPMFDAIVEAKEKYSEFKDKGSDLKKQYEDFRGPKQEKNIPKVEASPIGQDDDVDAIVKSLKKSEKEDKKRHEELIKTILRKEEARSRRDQSGFPDIGGTGPGPKNNNDSFFGFPPSRILMSILSRVALPAIAIGSAGLAGVAVGKTISDGMNKGRENIDWASDASSTFEVGPGKTQEQAAATISSGVGDPGGKSYGTYQLASKRGEVDKFLKHSGYAAQFEGLTVGATGFDEKWKQIAAIDPKFAEAQKIYAMETKYAPQMRKLADAGIDLSGKGKAVQDMVLSTANQYGADTNVISKALKGKNVSKMTGAEIVSAVQDYKGDTVPDYFKSSSPEVQASIARRVRKEKAFLLTKDKATNLSMAPPVTSIAASKRKVSQPERIQPDYAKQKTATSTNMGSNAAQGGPGEITIPGIDKLVAGLGKIVDKDDQNRSGVNQIRTEFDDTLLTLIAYDKI